MIAADAGHRLNHATTVAFGTQNGRVTVGGATDTLNGLVTVEARRWDGSSTPTTATSGRWCVTTAASAGTTWLGLLTAPVDTVVVRTSRAALTAWAPNTAVMRLDACQRSRRNNDIRGGNATLDPMSGVVAEVGWRSRTSQSVTRMTWDVSAFYARLRDEILSLDDPAAPGNSLTTNIDKTTHAGVEALRGATVEAGATHRVEPMVSVTLNRFRFDGDPTYGANTLPAAPAYAMRGEVIYKHATGIHAGPTFDLIGQRYADFANTYTVDGYGLMGLRAGLSRGRWEVFADVRNLFDADYIATVSVLNVANGGSRVLFPGAPRSAYTGVRFSF